MSDPNRYAHLFDLTPELVKEIEDQKEKAKAAREALAALKKLGVRTEDVEKDLDTLDSMTDTLLERFGNKKIEKQ